MLILNFLKRINKIKLTSMKLIKYTFLIVFIISISSCAVQKVKLKAFQNIEDQIVNSPINRQHQVGFIIKEIGESQNMFSYNAEKYFTPASNIKLYTFYTALNMLGDSIPSFQYEAKNDSLLIWPMADASFLHPNFKSQKAFDFLKNSGKNIYLIGGRYQGEKFGNGWSWDDFNEYYQTEITELPIYGNYISVKSKNGKIEMEPDLVAMYLCETFTDANTKNVKRAIESNNLTFPANVPANLNQAIPLHFNKGMVENLLSDTLLATGQIIKSVESLPYRQIPASAKKVYSIKADSLYKHFLQLSDNFMAEEILLNCAANNELKMNTGEVIKTSKEKYLSDLPDQMQWVDGSGLSRLNLTTPRNMVALLQKIYDKVGDEKRLFEMLPNGGKSGTLRNMFKSSPTPFVFAKSGSLSNNYNLSGYLIGKSGKKFVFSFMNNSYLNPTPDIRSEVERALTFIHDNY